MNNPNETRPSGKGPGSETPATGLRGESTSAERLARIARRRAARELTALIRRLDGGSIALPAAVEPRCDRPCLAVDKDTLHNWYLKYGACPCRTARQAGAS